MVKSNITKPYDLRTVNNVITKLNEKKNPSTIEKELLISRRTIGWIENKILNNEDFGPKIVDRSLFRNPNSKITESYIEELKKSVIEKPDFTAKQRAQHLFGKTGILISGSQVSVHLKSIHATKKDYSIIFTESTSEINQFRKKTFLKLHDPKSAVNRKSSDYIPLLLCGATDESGFDNDKTTKKGYGFIKKIKPIKNLFTNKNSGRSYRDNDTRIHKKAIKHSKYRLNIIATVYLDYQNPIPYFEINEETTTGSIYAKYVSDRVLPEHIKFDITIGILLIRLINQILKEVMLQLKKYIYKKK